jgi:hypothetical protein
LPLDGGKQAISSVDGVEHMFHSYVVSDERARSNCFGGNFDYAEIAHLSAARV